MQNLDATNLIDQIQKDMRQALKNGSRLECDTLRSLLARINSAEAIVRPQTNEPVIGVGSSEVVRKTLSLTDVRDVIVDEEAEIKAAFEMLDSSSDYAKELHEKMTIIQKYIKQ